MILLKGLNNKEYIDSFFHGYKKFIRFIAIIGVLLYASYLPIDYLYSPDNFKLLLYNRLTIIVVSVFASLLTYEKNYRIYFRYIMAFMHLLVGLSIIHTGYLDVRYMPGLFSVIMFFAVLTRSQYYYALSVNVILVIVYFFISKMHSNQVMYNFEINSIIAITVLFVSTLASYIKEKTLYENYKTNSLISNDIRLSKKLQQNVIKNISEHQKYVRMKMFSLTKEDIGGDIYNISYVDDNTLRIFLADAVGHGVQAAMITMLILSEYKRVNEKKMPVNKCLNLMNKNFLKYYDEKNKFFSCLMMDIDFKNKKLYFSSAGHPAQILIKENEFSMLKSSGGSIGIFDKMYYKLTEIDIKKGDKIVLYSDGIYEQFNDKGIEFGIKNFHRYIKQNKTEKIEKLCQDSYEIIMDFLNDNKINDDITLIGLEIK